MESGNKAVSLVDLIRPAQEDFNKAWMTVEGLMRLHKEMESIPIIDSEENTQDGE